MIDHNQLDKLKFRTAIYETIAYYDLLKLSDKDMLNILEEITRSLKE